MFEVILADSVSPKPIQVVIGHCGHDHAKIKQLTGSSPFKSGASLTVYPVKRQNRLPTRRRSHLESNDCVSTGGPGARFCSLLGLNYLLPVFQEQVSLAYNIHHVRKSSVVFYFGSYRDEWGKARTKRHEAYFWTRKTSFDTFTRTTLN